MKSLTLTIFLVISTFAVTLSKAPSRDRNKKPYKVVCYYGSWATYRPGDGKFPIDFIDPYICTHLVYGFAGLAFDNTIRSLDSYLDLEEHYGRGAFKQFNQLKKQNPELTTILAIGGWNEGSIKYSAMAKDAGKRKIFIDSCVKFLLQHDFDGLDMDWEYPANRGGVPEDKQNFVLLLKEMREAFDEHGLLITAAVSAGKATMDTAYDIPQISKYLDIINLMAYDYHGAWESVTGLNAPLYARPDEQGDEVFLNVNFSVNYWINQGASPKQIVLGMGLYGRAFTLQKPEENGIGATSTGPATAGPFTREPGTLGYNEICSYLMGGDWKVVVDPHQKSPYAYKGNQWVGYDDVESITLKVKYALDKGLGGGMVWSIETDDFLGKCHNQKFPLLTTIHELLNGEIKRPPTTPPPPTTTRDPNLPPPAKIECKTAGTFRNPEDCTKFYSCVPRDNGFEIIHYDCPAGTAFENGSCKWKDDVKDC